MHGRAEVAGGRAVVSHLLQDARARWHVRLLHQVGEVVGYQGGEGVGDGGGIYYLLLLFGF